MGRVDKSEDFREIWNDWLANFSIVLYFDHLIIRNLSSSLNIYLETGMILTNPLYPEEDRVGGMVGLPFPQVEVKIIKQETGVENDISEENQVGMLVVKGPNVFKSYYNRNQSIYQVVGS